MARTFEFFFIFRTGLLINILLILCLLLNLLKNKDLKRRYVKLITSEWSKFTLFTAGIKVRTEGLENIPGKKSGYVLISNHESTSDVIILMSTIPFTPAFVAKAELMKFPLIRSWMTAMECPSIDRRLFLR